MDRYDGGNSEADSRLRFGAQIRCLWGVIYVNDINQPIIFKDLCTVACVIDRG